jgi:chorismate dehydratase
VCAVSYLNTVPLVWGFEHSPDQGLREIFDLSFAVPSLCADRLRSGEADIGIVPVIEMARQKLEYFRETGIACRGPVRTILLISKVPFREIRTLATDMGSRTSVMLSRVILAEKYGATPRTVSRAPDLAAMLGEADAALIIGDAALLIDPATLPFETLDLGAEWITMTGLPMVFAVWSGRKEMIREEYARAFVASCRYGMAHMDEMAREQAPIREISEAAVREYLTRNVAFDLGEKEHQGLQLYLKHALALDRVTVPAGA